MKELPIVWQRLVKEGSTCPRCHSTGEEVERAIVTLAETLKSLGIIPKLEYKEIDESAFLKDTLQSNQILISGKPIEFWLGGQTGKSECCNECGNNECRTVEFAGESHEVIPEELIVRAGIIAAAKTMG